jgi:hypothetical protein
MSEENSSGQKLGDHGRALVPLAANNKHKLFLDVVDGDILDYSGTETPLEIGHSSLPDEDLRGFSPTSSSSTSPNLLDPHL